MALRADSCNLKMGTTPGGQLLLYLVMSVVVTVTGSECLVLLGPSAFVSCCRLCLFVLALSVLTVHGTCLEGVLTVCYTEYTILLIPEHYTGMTGIYPTPWTVPSTRQP